MIDYFTVITIYPNNPVTNLAYKTANNETPCTGTIGDQYIKCMENETYSAEDIFPFNKGHFKVRSYYIGNSHGMVHSVTIDPGVILTSSARTLTIKMNPNISYVIVMTDPKLRFMISNPKVVPRTVLILGKNSGTIQLYLQVINFDVRISSKVNRQDFYTLQKCFIYVICRSSGI